MRLLLQKGAELDVQVRGEGQREEGGRGEREAKGSSIIFVLFYMILYDMILYYIILYYIILYYIILYYIIFMYILGRRRPHTAALGRHERETRRDETTV